MSDIKRFLEDLHHELASTSTWHTVVTRRLISAYGGGHLLNKYHGCHHLLRHFVEEYHGSVLRRGSHQYKSETQVLLMLVSSLPGVSILRHYLYRDCGKSHSMEFDIFMPQVAVAVEYQGEQHYHPVPLLGNITAAQAINDQNKRAACEEHGITLIEIPYWWDRRRESLLATVYQHRPDLISTGISWHAIPAIKPS